MKNPQSMWLKKVVAASHEPSPSDGLETRDQAFQNFSRHLSYENSLKARYLKQSKWPPYWSESPKIDFLLSVLRGSTCWELMDLAGFRGALGVLGFHHSQLSQPSGVPLVLPSSRVFLRVAQSFLGSLLFEICTVVPGVSFFLFFFLVVLCGM